MTGRSFDCRLADIEIALREKYRAPMTTLLLRDVNAWPTIANRLREVGATRFALVPTADGSYVFEVHGGDVERVVAELIDEQLVGRAGGERKSVAVAMGYEETEAGDG